MAERIRQYVRNLMLAYPRSVFDMRPVDLSHFESQDDAVALCGDWLNVCQDVKKVAWRIYVKS